MPTFGHDHRAFDNWYSVDSEDLTFYEQQILASDEISTFRLAAQKSLVSDDVVDEELWLSIRGSVCERGENETDWNASR